MPKLTPVKKKVMECIVKRLGYEFYKQNGTSHRVFRKDGQRRPLVVDQYDELDPSYIRRLISQMEGITRDDYFNALKKCK